jgi:hypothetical protein
MRCLCFVTRQVGPSATDARGIHVMDEGKVAWFRDPDRNTFAIEEERR